MLERIEDFQRVNCTKDGRSTTHHGAEFNTLPSNNLQFQLVKLGMILAFRTNHKYVVFVNFTNYVTGDYQCHKQF